MSLTSGFRDVRPSPIAGTWYPGEQKRLAAVVDGLMAAARPCALPGPVAGLVAPHAGYAYSGGIAAHSFAQLRGASYDTVVLLGPDHQGNCGAYGVAAYKHYATPLGLIEVDTGLIDRLSRLVAVDLIDDDGEHSLEIQLPFLQRSLGSFKLLPIMLGYPLMPGFEETGLRACRTLSKALAEALAGRTGVLLVASSDLAHLYNYADVVRKDKVFTELLASFDAQAMAEALLRGECQACGGAAVVTIMEVAQARGASKATILGYANSGDVTGRRSSGEYTVGYAAAALTTPAVS